MIEKISQFFKKNPEQIAREKRKQEILSLIRSIEKQVMPIQQFRELQNEQVILTSKESSGVATQEEKQRLKEIHSLIATTSLKFDNLFDFKIALECVPNSSKSFVQKTLNHENAHANKGEGLGLGHNGYTIIFTSSQSFGSSEKDITSTPMVNFDEFPLDWNEDQIKNVTIQVTYAPEEYGDKMSDADRMIYNKLQSQQ